MPQSEDERPYPGLYHDQMIGLNYVYLENGVFLGDYHGEETICIHSCRDLWDAVGAVLVKGWRPLRGPEARWLRRHLDLSQEDLASAIGVSRASVARWEANLSSDAKAPAAELLAKHDRALRLYAASALGLAGLDALLRKDGFAGVQVGEPAILLRLEGEEWKVADDTFGRAGGRMEDPRLWRRKLCVLMTGEPYGDEDQKRVVDRFETWGLGEAIRIAGELAKSHKLQQWHLDHSTGRYVPKEF